MCRLRWVLAAALLAVFAAQAHGQVARFAGAVSGGQGIASSPRLASILADVAAGRSSHDLLPAGQFEPVEVGKTGAGSTLIFAFSGSGMLGEIRLFTKGKKSIEFADVGTGTCVAGLAFRPGTTCTVELTFHPAATGTRYCAVDLTSDAGSVLAIGYAYGIGLEARRGAAGTVANAGANDGLEAGAKADGGSRSRAPLPSKEPARALTKVHTEAQQTDETLTTVNLSSSLTSVPPGGSAVLTAITATTARPAVPSGTFTFYATPQQMSFTPAWEGPIVSLGEGWTNDGINLFTISPGLLRKVNNDKTWSVIAQNASPFVGLTPGVDHLGDGKYYNGFVYGVAQDNAYAGTCTFRYGTIVVYSATEAGLPLVNWNDVSGENHDLSAIAVVPSQNALYVSSYCDGSQLWIYDLTSLQLKGTLALSQDILQIQGLTFNPATNSLFMAADAIVNGAQFGGSIYQISLSGTVTKVYDVAGPGELEGVDFFQGDMGYAMGPEVHFLSGGPVALGTSGVESAKGTLTSGALSSGINLVTAVYSGDAKYAPATSSALAVTMTRLAPNITVVPAAGSSSASPVSIAQALNVAIAVGGNGTTPSPTGSVILTAGAGGPASAAAGGWTSAAVQLNAGAANITIPAWALHAGNLAFSAAYTPDSASAGYYNSGSASTPMTVTLATPAVAARSSAAIITSAQKLTVAANVAAPSGGAMPTGTVSVTAGSYTSIPVALIHGSAIISVPPFSIPAGSAPMVLAYTPDAVSQTMYAGATASNSLTVGKAIPAIAMAPSAFTVSTSQALPVTVAVSSVAGSPTPTGRVAVINGHATYATQLAAGTGLITIPAGALRSGTVILGATYTPDAASATAYGQADTAVSVSVSAASTGASTASSIYASSPPAQGFSSQTIGATSAPQTFNFSLPAGVTVGSIAVLTMGAPLLDFAQAPGGTCRAQSYPSGAACTVNVTFTPQAAGTRVGAVVLFSGASNSGAVLASVPLLGTGTGAQIGYASNAVVAVPSLTNLSGPSALAVDGSGNVYIADAVNNRVVEASASGAASVVMAPIVNTMALSAPAGVAVDGAGNLFIADTVNRIIELPAGGGAPIAMDPIVNGAGLNGPAGMAVDGLGDLFIADSNNNRVVELALATGLGTVIAPTVNGLGLNAPQGLAFDSAGDLFIADTANNRVVKVPASSSTAGVVTIAPSVSGTALSSPTGVAVDATGTLYIAQMGGGLIEVLPGGTAIYAAYATNLKGPATAVSLDDAGNLYVAAAATNQVMEYPRASAPVLTFATATPVGIADAIDGKQTVSIANIGNSALMLGAVSYPADFAAATGDSLACTAASSLAPGSGCDVPVKFAPAQSGSLSEPVTIAGTSAAGAPLLTTFSTNGTALADQPATMMSPTAGTTVGTTATFTWSGGVGVTGYSLLIGYFAGSAGIYNSNQIVATSVTAPIPSNGVKLFVRLNQLFGGTWHSYDSTYMEPGTAVPAVISSPVAGSLLTGASATFSWAGAVGPNEYVFCASAKAIGQCDLYNSGILTTATSVTMTLPQNGKKIYVELGQMMSGTWSTAGYTYTSQLAASQ